MTDAVIGRRAGATSFSILGAITFCHLLNDLSTSLLLAIYPLLKSEFDLSFGQIGLLTLVFQGTGSLLQPVVGLLYRPPAAALLAAVRHGAASCSALRCWRLRRIILMLLAGAAHCWASAHRSFIRNPRGLPVSPRAARTASRNRCFRSAAISAIRWRRWRRPFSCCPTASAASPGSRFSHWLAWGS